MTLSISISISVGAGTAGSVVAARLSEIPNVTVLVLEAGHDDYDYPHTQWIPMEQELQLTDFDWQYKTISQETCCDGSKNNVSFDFDSRFFIELIFKPNPAQFIFRSTYLNPLYF